MALTEKQRKKRSRYLCASDFPAIMDESPFENQTQHNVWLGKVYPEEYPASSEAMDRGNRYEKPLVEYFSNRLRMHVSTAAYKLEFTKPFSNPKLGSYMAHLDGLIYRVKGRKVIFTHLGVEAKLTSDWEGWGEEEFTDVVPNHVLLQTHAQCFICDLEMVYIVVILPWYGRITERIYRIQRDNELIERMTKYGEVWWDRFVNGDISPPGESDAPDLDLIRRIKRQPNKTVELKPELVSTWEKAKTARKEAEKAEAVAQGKMLAALGDAEGGKLPSGRLLTYLPTKPRVTVKREALEHNYSEAYLHVRNIGKPGRKIKIEDAPKAQVTT